MKGYLNFLIDNWKAFAYFFGFSIGAFVLEYLISGFNPTLPLMLVSITSGMMFGASIERMED